MTNFLKKRLLFIFLLILFLLPLSMNSPAQAQNPPFSLVSGWNQITWPALSDFTAKTTLENIDSNCGGGTSLAMAQKEQDFWEEYVVDYGGKNFALTNGRYYYLKVSRQCTWDPTTPPSRYYGYVTSKGRTSIDDLPIVELGAYTNVLHLYHKYRGSNNHFPSASDLRTFRENNIKLVLKIDNNIVDIVEQPDGTKEDMYDEAKLIDLKNHLEPYKDVIYTIFVIDEPYKPKKNYTYQFLNDRVQQVKEIFTDYPMMINFLHPYYIRRTKGGNYPDIPSNIDIIGFDTYWYPPNSLADLDPNRCHDTSSIKRYYKECVIGDDIDILREKAPGKPILFYTTAFSCFPYGGDDTTYCQERCAFLTQNCPTNYPATAGAIDPIALQQAQWDYEITVEQGLESLVWYFYDPGGGWALGASNYPLLLEKHEEIGQMLIEGGR